MSCTPPDDPASRFERKKHISFLLRCLRMLPQPYTSADDQRMTLGYFAISGLDLLSSTEKIPRDERQELIEWVYDQQCATGGFRGSPSCPAASSSQTRVGGAGANVAMTYAALLILAVLRDDFGRLERRALLRFVEALQDRSGEGGFAAEEEAAGGVVDRDPRFTYCAVAICSMLGEWGTVDRGKAREYLEACQRYDGGFGASRMHEAHSGMTYCCVAGLRLLAGEDSAVLWNRQEEALAWLVHRQVAPSQPAPHDRHTQAAQDPSQTSPSPNDDSDDDEQPDLTGGFQGRPEKLPPDVCYSFWNGAALSLLDAHQLIDAHADASYVLSAQSKVGGIAKIPEEHPDLLHTYLGLASLSLHQSGEAAVSGDAVGEGIELGLKRLDAAYNCSWEASEWIRTHLTRSL